jgi:hypothetical protein
MSASCKQCRAHLCCVRKCLHVAYARTLAHLQSAHHVLYMAFLLGAAFSLNLPRRRTPDGSHLQQVAELGLLEKALSLVDVTEVGAIANHLSPQALFLLLATLTTCAQGSPPLAHSLLHGSLHTHLAHALANSSVALANNKTTSVVKSQSQLLQARCQVLVAVNLFGCHRIASVMPLPPALQELRT